MDITCISDLHGHYPTLEGGDLLIVAGDLTERNEKKEYVLFADWYLSQKYKKKVLIAGNHDGKIENGDYYFNHEWFGYLCDSGTEFEGLKIWGSPWTVKFKGLNPHCAAFTGSEDFIAKKFDLIPHDTDILITHSPPFTILDKILDGRQVGSPSLLGQHVLGLRPKLWVWGHIHEAYGQDGPYNWNNTQYVNASHMDENYIPVNPPIRIIL